MVSEGVGRDSQVGVHRAPVAEEGVIVDGVDLFEEDGYFDAWLEIWLRVVVHLRVGELVRTLVPRHYEVRVYARFKVRSVGYILHGE